MHPTIGETVYHISEIYAVKSEIQAGINPVEYSLSKTLKVAAAKTLHPLCLANGVDIVEAGLLSIQYYTVVLNNGYNSLFY